ncbi:MAG: DJ-1/PfpI family protein [Solirubrobacteraceae bacterium]
MRIEIILFAGFDELDAIAPYEVLSNLRRQGCEVEVALVTLAGPDQVTAAHGAVVEAPERLSERPQVLVVPGGGWADGARAGVRAELAHGALPAAIARRHAAGTLVASVCTGAMLLVAAGLLTARPATTHHVALDDLRAAGAQVINARVVDDGDLITAAGVTSGLDLALWLAERLFGARAALALEQELEYERRGTVWRVDQRRETG